MSENAGLQAKLEALKRLNRNRFDYVLARSGTKTIEAALRQIELSRAWYDKFTPEEKAELERLADELHYEKKIQAELMLVEAAPLAAACKIDGLTSRDSKIRQAAASDILDRVGVKAPTRTELTGADGGPIVVNWDEPHND